MERSVVWLRESESGAEYSQVRIEGDRLKAEGVAVGTGPVAYRLDYRLETAAGFVTKRFRAVSRGAGWQRTLDLRRSARGDWSVRREAEEEAAEWQRGQRDVARVENRGMGGPELPQPESRGMKTGLARAESRGTRLPDLAGALDCDLGLSPLTNSLPVLRRGLLRGGGPVELVMAWIAVPELTVEPLAQRYTFLHRAGANAVVRYENADGSFSADIVFDADGLVLEYPGIGRSSR